MKVSELLLTLTVPPGSAGSSCARREAALTAPNNAAPNTTGITRSIALAPKFGSRSVSTRWLRRATLE
ncbi:MAG: hypothetical protein DHS20C15_06400 [Planctomycetota bacterium]|nr:MAG: hypothetical protein DHS20C15_06400 [Planctomycetota bacterium]